MREKIRNFFKQFLIFWKKTYSIPIQVIFLLILLGGCYVIYTNAILYKQVEDAKDFFSFLAILIVLILTPPFLRTLLFYVRKLALPMTTFQKYLIGLIFCILTVLVLILIKVF